MIEKSVWIIEERNYGSYEENTNEVFDVSLISVEDAMNKCELACKEYCGQGWNKSKFDDYVWNENKFVNRDHGFEFWELVTQY